MISQRYYIHEGVDSCTVYVRMLDDQLTSITQLVNNVLNKCKVRDPPLCWYCIKNSKLQKVAVSIMSEFED